MERKPKRSRSNMPPLMLDPVLGVATAGLVVYWVHPIAREQDLPIKV